MLGKSEGKDREKLQSGCVLRTAGVSEGGRRKSRGHVTFLHLRWLPLSSTGSRAQGLSSCSSQLLQHRLDGCGTWDLPRSGVEPVSPASAGRFTTTEPPGKPLILPFLSSPPLGHSVFRNLSYEHLPLPPYNAATKLQLLTLFSPDGKNYLPGARKSGLPGTS